MALYIPTSRRRRHAALLALATLAAGLIIGFLVGRSTAVTASERAAEVQSQGDTLGTRIDALTIEYEQAVAGTGDTVQGGVLDALDLIDADMDQLITLATWLGPAQAAQLHAATAAVRTAAVDLVTPDAFADIAATSSTTIRATFGADA